MKRVFRGLGCLLGFASAADGLTVAGPQGTIPLVLPATTELAQSLTKPDTVVRAGTYDRPFLLAQ